MLISAIKRVAASYALQIKVPLCIRLRWFSIRLPIKLSSRPDFSDANIPDQIQHLPKECTHLVLSVGGNNALTEASRLGISFFGMTGEPTSKSLDSLADISSAFESQYRSSVDACLRPRLSLGVCTIYNGCFPDKSYQRIASLALAIFNDVIIRVAIERGLPVIDLRLICKAPADYANPIEPSSIGGEKIAKAIVALVTGRDEQICGTRILSAPRIFSTPD